MLLAAPSIRAHRKPSLIVYLLCIYTIYTMIVLTHPRKDACAGSSLYRFSGIRHRACVCFVCYLSKTTDAKCLHQMYIRACVMACGRLCWRRLSNHNIESGPRTSSRICVCIPPLRIFAAADRLVKTEPRDAACE